MYYWSWYILHVLLLPIVQYIAEWIIYFSCYHVISTQFLLALPMTDLHWEIWLATSTSFVCLCGSSEWIIWLWHIVYIIFCEYCRQFFSCQSLLFWILDYLIHPLTGSNIVKIKTGSKIVCWGSHGLVVNIRGFQQGKKEYENKWMNHY